MVMTRGLIEEILKQGTRVKRGDVIFRMDASRARDEVNKYELRIQKEKLVLVDC